MCTVCANTYYVMLQPLYTVAFRAIFASLPSVYALLRNGKAKAVVG